MVSKKIGKHHRFGKKKVGGRQKPKNALLLSVVSVAAIALIYNYEAQNSGEDTCTSISSVDNTLVTKLTYSQRWDSFAIWLNENTFTDAISNVIIDPELEYRGSVASRNIAKGESVMFVPRKSLFTVADVVDGRALEGIPVEKANLIRDFASVLSGGENEGYDHCILAVCILWHRFIGIHRRTKWSTYVNSLPSYISGMPRNYNQMELKLLEGTQTLALAEGRVRRINRQYRNIRDNPRWLAVLEHFTLEDYLWARDMVDSRSFSITINGSDYDSMIPLADMPNHDLDCPCSWDYDNELEGFVAFARCGHDQGDTIMMNYGDKPNSALLCTYGFALEDNPYDAVDILIKSNHTGKLVLKCSLEMDIDGELSEQCLGTLYYHYLNVYKGTPSETEEKLFEYIKFHAEEAVEFYENPDKVNEEESLLASENTTMNTRFALLARRSEYKVWKEWREVAIASLSDIRRCKNAIVPW